MTDAASRRIFYRRVDFKNFKALRNYRVDINEFNILVGPNNAGKSTIIAAFRILAAAIRKAESRRAEIVTGPRGSVRGYKIDLSPISVAEENLFYNYDDSESAEIVFTMSNGYRQTLYFPEQGVCHYIVDADGKVIESPASFKRHFDCGIGFVPILGPVDHNEPLYGKDAARLALFSYRAARNFRNIWFHYPDQFEEFREMLQRTWPGMDVEAPTVEHRDSKAFLFMFCPEKRFPREIFWSGFGFQVWCQMLTHLIQSKNNSLFLIDEPDIYLHSELQRQLLDLLRNLGPDVLIATHSTEIVTESFSDEIVIIDKEKRRSKRIKDPSRLGEVFSALGSNINPILTQLAKTRRALFVEGKDFQLIGRFARRLGAHRVGNRGDFAVVSLDGFSPERMKNLKAGMEATLGVKVLASLILDRDYRSDAERNNITKQCRAVADYVSLHDRKEIENYLLVPAAIDRAIEKALAKRSSPSKFMQPWAGPAIDEFAANKKAYVQSQYVSQARVFGRVAAANRHETEISEEVLEQIEGLWATPDGRVGLIPGKDALGYLNERLQAEFGVSVTPGAIVDAMRPDEIPKSVIELVAMLQRFADRRPDDDPEESGTVEHAPTVGV